MSFTKQTPTKPGAYWWKYETELVIAIVTEYGGRLYSSVNGKARQHVELVGGEWEGPLVTADEAQADLRVEKGEAMSDTPISDAAASTTMYVDGEPVVEIKICRDLERKLQKAQADAAVMRGALAKERAAIVRFLVPWRSHLDQSWLDNFVESGSVRFNDIGYVFPVEVSSDAGRELLAELQRLRAWKAEQIAVENQWDAQAVGKALGLPIGVDIRKNILPKIHELTTDLAKAQAQCVELRSEVEKAWHEGFIDGDFGEARADDCWNQSRARKIATGELNK